VPPVGVVEPAVDDATPCDSAWRYRAVSGWCLVVFDVPSEEPLFEPSRIVSMRDFAVELVERSPPRSA
jgi:hypothetical protein